MSDRAICERLSLSRATIWEWKHDPRFRAWLRTELDRTSDEHWPLILRRHELLAIQGSVKSAEFIGKVRLVALKAGAGAPLNTDEFDGKGDITTNYQVNVLVQQTPQGTVNLLVPRPPALEESTT